MKLIWCTAKSIEKMMAHVDLTKKNFPNAKQYSIIAEDKSTFHFIITIGDVYEFMSVAKNYIFNKEATWSDCRQVFGFTDSGNIRSVCLIFKDKDKDSNDNELFYFKKVLKLSKFKEINK